MDRCLNLGDEPFPCNDVTLGPSGQVEALLVRMSGDMNDTRAQLIEKVFYVYQMRADFAV